MQRRLRFFEQLEPRRMLASLVYNVNDTSDTFNGSFSTIGFGLNPTFILSPNPNEDGKLSLREAIYLANQAALGDDVTINLAANATYNLSRTDPWRFSISNTENSPAFYAFGDLDIRHQVKINGNGAKIDAKGISRVIEVRGAFPVELNNVTIAGGRTTGIEQAVGGGGMAVFGGANVTLQNVTITDNRDLSISAETDHDGDSAFGGGLYVDNAGGTITVTGSTISNNQALGQAGGRADANDDGGDGGAAWGGGIFVHQGNVSVTGITFSNNRAIGGAGGEADDDPATGGDGGDSNGGAIAVGAGTLTITNSTFRDNRAGIGNTTGGRSPDVGGRGGGAAGGAIFLTDSGAADIQGTTFTKNIANASTGGFGDNRGGDGGRAVGGAILAGGNTLNVQNTSVSENAALGGLGGRSYGDGGNGGAGRGGAIFTKAGGSWTGDTFTHNRAVGGDGNRTVADGRGGDGGDATGGAIFLEAPTQTTIQNGQVVVTSTPIQLTIANPVFTGNDANAGNGDRGTESVGGRGGTAAGGAISTLGPVTLAVNVDTDGPHFSENNARGGSGGNSFRAGMGDGGAASGGAIHSPGGPLTLTGLEEKPVSFGGNFAIAGNAGSVSYAELSDGDVTPGRGGDASGGAIYAGAGFTAEYIGLVQNVAMSGRGSDGKASTTIAGEYRFNDPDKGRQVKDLAVTTHGSAAGSSGRAQGGAVWVNGTADVVVGIFIKNAAFGGRADDTTTFVGGRGGQDDRGRGLPGGRGGDAQGGALFTTGGGIKLEDSVFLNNQAAAGPGGAGGSSLLTLDRIDGQTLYVVPTGQPGGGGGDGGNASGGAVHASVNGASEVINTQFMANQAIAGRGGVGGPGALGDDSAHGGDAGRGGDAQGGAITILGASATTVAISESIFTQSTVVGGDGGIGGPGGSSGNGGRGGDGGLATGGGLVLDGPSLSVVASTVSENVTSGGWGGSGGDGGFGAETGGNGGNGGNAASSRGGGIAVVSGRLDLDRSTVFGNLVLAGYGGQGGNGGNSNVTGGRGDDSGNGGVAEGGGVWIGYGATPGAIHASTIVGNGVEAGGFGLFGDAGHVPRDGKFPEKRSVGTIPGNNLAVGSAAVLFRGIPEVRASALSTPSLQTSGDTLGLETATAAGVVGGVGLTVSGSVAVTTLLSTQFIAVSVTTEFLSGAKLVSIAALLGLGGGSLATIAVVGTGVVLLGAVVVAAFVLGDGDFVDGLEQLSDKFLLDPSDQPKYSLGLLFSNVDEEEELEPADGLPGRNGARGVAVGPNFFAVQFNPDNPLQSPHVTPRATFSQTILEGGKAVTRDRIRHAPDVASGSTLSIKFVSDSPPFLLREIVNVIENPADLAGAPVASNGNNFVGVAASGFTSTGDQHGTAAEPLELKSVGFLQLESGAITPTLRLQPDSPARDAGPVLSADETSQNGFVWQAGTRPEIGAWGAGVNREPVAADFSIAIKQGEPVEIKLSDLLANSSDPDGDLRRLSFVDTTLQSSGILNFAVGSAD
jgi:hypothetical protein